MSKITIIRPSRDLYKIQIKFKIQKLKVSSIKLVNFLQVNLLSNNIKLKNQKKQLKISLLKISFMRRLYQSPYNRRKNQTSSMQLYLLIAMINLMKYLSTCHILHLNKQTMKQHQIQLRQSNPNNCLTKSLRQLLKKEMTSKSWMIIN